MQDVTIRTSETKFVVDKGPVRLPDSPVHGLLCRG